MTTRRTPRLALSLAAGLGWAGAAMSQPPISWSPEARLVAPDAAEGDELGEALALSGDTLAVGAPGADADAGRVYIFERHGAGRWGSVAELRLPNSDADDSFGEALALDGDLLVVGASGDDEGGNGAGAAYVFHRDAGGRDAWGQVARLTAPDAQPGDHFGSAVAVDRGTIAVGAPQAEPGGGITNGGVVYVFGRRLGAVEVIARLTASDGAQHDDFGEALALQAGTLLVGAPDADHSGRLSPGAVYVFAPASGGTEPWREVAKLIGSDPGDFDSFGAVLDLDGSTALIGAPSRDGAYFFERDPEVPEVWKETTLVEDVGIAGALDLSGDRAVLDGAGSVALVLGRDPRDRGRWQLNTELADSDGLGEDGFGSAVALEGGLLAVAAPLDDHAAEDAGTVYVYRGHEVKLSVAGACPGPVSLELVGATPGAPVALAVSDALGRSPLPGEQCGETFLYLEAAQLLALERADDAGRVSLRGRSETENCRIYQAVDLAACQPSNVARLSFAAYAQVVEFEAPDELYAYGTAVALDGRRAVVAEQQTGGFVHEASDERPWEWELVAHFEPEEPIPGQYLVSAALSGDTAALADLVGGAAYVFEKDRDGPGKWGQVVKLTAPDDGGAYEDNFGDSIALEGDLLAVGATFQDGADIYDGTVSLHERDAGGANEWGRISELWDPAGTNDSRFGGDVDIDGRRVAVGASRAAGVEARAGAAFVFEPDSRGNWTLTARLIAPDGVDGDNFGQAVAMDGDWLAVGARGFSEPENDSGAVYLFQRRGSPEGEWQFAQRIQPALVSGGDEFGLEVALVGDTLLVGSDPPVAPQRSGAVYVFERDHGGRDAWGEVDLLVPSDGEQHDGFGESVALSGSTLITGAEGHGSGAAYLFVRTPRPARPDHADGR